MTTRVGKCECGLRVVGCFGPSDVWACFDCGMALLEEVRRARQRARHNSGRDATRKAREREHGAQDTEAGIDEDLDQREEKE